MLLLLLVVLVNISNIVSINSRSNSIISGNGMNMMLLSTLLSPDTDISDAITNKITKTDEKKKKSKKTKKSKRNNIKHNKTTKITLSKSDSSKSKSDEEIAAMQQTRDMQIQMASSVLYMIASRFIFSMNYSDPKILMIARLVFVLYIVASQLLIKILKDKINNIEDETIISNSSFNIKDGMKMFGLGGNNMLEGLLGKANSNNDNKITVREYDLAEVKKLSQGLFFEIIAASYMHFVNKAGKPLIIIPVMGLLNKIKSPIVQLHLMGYKAVGQLSRPFKAGFENMLAQAKAQSQAKDVDANNADDVENNDKANNADDVENNDDNRNDDVIDVDNGDDYDDNTTYEHHDSNNDNDSHEKDDNINNISTD